MSDAEKTNKQIVVAAVLSNGRVIINAGSADNIKLGQSFLIYAMGDEIADPVTQKSLGRIELIRGRGKVKHVQQNMAHVESTETRVRSRARPMFIALTGPSDEIEEVPFDGAEVGDLCRPI